MRDLVKKNWKPGKVCEIKCWGILGQHVTFEELSNAGENSPAYTISIGKLKAFKGLYWNAAAGDKRCMGR